MPASASRRHFLCAFIAVSASLARAQSPGRLPRIGVLANSVSTEELLSGASRGPGYVGIMEGLPEKGWIPGKNVEVVWRSGENNLKTLDQHARDLAAQLKACDGSGEAPDAGR
jgi:hypothetical protein